MKVLLATPTKDHTVFVPYLKAILRLHQSMSTRRPDLVLEVETKSGLLVDAARNYFATRILADKSFTHLLFVDADMGFEPELIEKMIDFGKPVVAAMYPVRRRNETKWLSAARVTQDVEVANARSLDFVSEGSLAVAEVPGTNRSGVRMENGFVQVNRAGTGIMLIQRQVIDAMRLRFQELWVSEAPDVFHFERGVPNGLFQCFAPRQTSTGFFYGEDFAFCTRWVEECGGEIWSCITEKITHSGPTTFSGKFADKLGVSQAVVS